VITSKNVTRLGGNVLWLRPEGTLWTAYYAHLDRQLVKAGDYVRKGQVIGTVGNTGNARTTPSHLHFGIYTWEGAINPYPVVKNSPKIVSPGITGRQQQMLAANMPEKKVKKKQSAEKKSARQYAQKTKRARTDRSAQYYARAGGKKTRKGSKHFIYRIMPGNNGNVIVYVERI
jgi:murein DD-endopeptidase MepM/ murein hydrolase activator NlpD